MQLDKHAAHMYFTLLSKLKFHKCSTFVWHDIPVDAYYFELGNCMWRSVHKILTQYKCLYLLLLSMSRLNILSRHLNGSHFIHEPPYYNIIIIIMLIMKTCDSTISGSNQRSHLCSMHLYSAFIAICKI